MLQCIKSESVTPGSVFTIADFGCADGGTSMPLLYACVKELREIHGDSLPIHVVYEDQPVNDFKSLFLRLQGILSIVQKLLEMLVFTFNVQQGSETRTPCIHRMWYIVSKGGFPLSLNFCVPTRLKFTRVNEMEVMSEKPRADVKLSKVKLSSYFCVILCLVHNVSNDDKLICACIKILIIRHDFMFQKIRRSASQFVGEEA